MAQCTGEPLSSVAEGISASIPLTLTLIATVSPTAQSSHPLVREVPLYSVGHWQTFAPSELVTESVLVIATRVLEILLTASPSQGFVTSDTHPTAATSVIGSLLSR